MVDIYGMSAERKKDVAYAISLRKNYYDFARNQLGNTLMDSFCEFTYDDKGTNYNGAHFYWETKSKDELIEFFEMHPSMLYIVDDSGKTLHECIADELTIREYKTLEQMKKIKFVLKRTKIYMETDELYKEINEKYKNECEILYIIGKNRAKQVDKIQDLFESSRQEYWKSIVDIYGIDTYNQIHNLVVYPMSGGIQWNEMKLHDLEIFWLQDKRRQYICDDYGNLLGDYIENTHRDCGIISKGEENEHN